VTHPVSSAAVPRNRPGAVDRPATWRELVRSAADRLTAAGVATAVTDAELLAASAAGLDRGRLRVTVASGAGPEPGAAGRFAAAVDRRARREPLQHITGTAPFRHLELAVGPGVFVPRPETELLAGWAVAAAATALSARGTGHAPSAAPGGRTPARGPDPVQVVDLGTGSGAIAAAVATEVPGVSVLAVEVDPRAADWARRNLDPLGVAVVVADGGCLPELRPDLCGATDVVVTNPPYIPLDAWESVSVEVRDHDPAAALWGGADGLDTVRRLLRCARRLLRPGGVVGIEHADVQGASVPALLVGDGGFAMVRDHRDLTGRPRFTTAIRTSTGPGR